MDVKKLSGLQPASVFRYFEEICAIPHGSGNTKKISDYLVSVAKAHNIRYVQDALNNVLLFKDATAGYENHAPVILQGHMDMVCEKEPELSINMETDGLEISHDGTYIFANGTTLGGDDGIAVAYGLALLEATDLAHPRLELVITVDEETGKVYFGFRKDEGDKSGVNQGIAVYDPATGKVSNYGETNDEIFGVVINPNKTQLF